MVMMMLRKPAATSAGTVPEKVLVPLLNWVQLEPSAGTNVMLVTTSPLAWRSGVIEKLKDCPAVRVMVL